MNFMQPPDPEKNCWKQIGIFSREKPVCPRLAEVIHCRNCAVFSRASRELLDQEVPDGYALEWEAALSVSRDEEPSDTLSAVIFRIGTEWLAIRTRLFSEIVDMSPFHSLPHRRNAVLRGIVNIHGEIQLCVSLRNLLGIPEKSPEKTNTPGYRRMIVLCRDRDKWVFAADEVFGACRVRPDNLEHPPATIVRSPSAFTQYLFKWQEKTVALLDDDLLFTSLARNVQ